MKSQAIAKGHAVDGRNQRLAAALGRLQERQHASDERTYLLGRDRKAADVRAGAERLVAAAGDHADAYLVVGLDHRQAFEHTLADAG